MIARRIVLPVALSAALAFNAYAQAPGAGISFIPAQQADEWSTSSLVGVTVQNPAGEAVGSVNYIVLNGQGSVTAVVIGVGGVLGVAEKNVAVPFQALTLGRDAKGFMTARLAATKEGLSEAPAYAWKEPSTLDMIKDKASELAEKAKESAKELSQKAKDAIKSDGTSPPEKKP
jgi:sporulation protein YlmC with PRC-barrel domain